MAQPREKYQVPCLECGRWFVSLPRHLARAHDMEVDDYRAKHDIPVGVPLVSVDWSERVSAANVVRDAKRTLVARGPVRGFRQKVFVREQRAAHYRSLAAKGNMAAAMIDKTAERRRKLGPYPVTPEQAAQRLGCTVSAARTFLSYCSAKGKLVRVRRGLYADPDSLIA